MAVQLFRLRNVPDDEAEEIRLLLKEQDINFYETTAGSWGISMPAIWLKDEAQLTRAKACIADYQQQRAANAQALYAKLKAEGKHRNTWDLIRENPAKFFLFLLAALLVLYVSTAPFLHFLDVD